MTRQDLTDLQTQIDAIPGFLFPVAAQATAWLLADQVERRHKGGLLEIGVFQGKYFVVLARSAQQNGDALLGIDNFMYSNEEAVHAALRAAPESASARARLIARPSTDVSLDDIRSVLERPARFISVDGSHEADDVHHDLLLADEVLGDDGIVAIDDFLNPRALGVGEATHLFFSEDRNLSPFALTGNKLFVCRPPALDFYADSIRAFFAASDLPEGRAFRELSALGAEHVEQRLHGATLVVM